MPTFILTNKHALNEATDLVVKCYEARKTQQYVVSVERYDPEHSDQQKKMFFAMMTELLHKIQGNKYLYVTKEEKIEFNIPLNFNQEELVDTFATICPYWPMKAVRNILGVERQERVSINKIGKRGMIQVIDYAFKWSQDTFNVSLDSFYDHKTANGEDT